VAISITIGITVEMRDAETSEDYCAHQGDKGTDTRRHGLVSRVQLP